MRHAHPAIHSLSLSTCLLLGPISCATAQLASAPAHAAAEHRQATITVTGVARVQAPPEELHLSLAVVTKSTKAADALELNSRTMKRVVSALKKLDLSEKAITTVQVSVQPDVRYDKNLGQQIVGYIVQNSVRVKSAKLDLAGEIIQAGVDAGASTASSMFFALKDEAPYRAQAIASATRSARAQADAAAAAAGVHIVRVQAIQIGAMGGGPAPMMRNMAGAVSAVASAPPPPVTPGDITVRATITITFAIE